MKCYIWGAKCTNLGTSVLEKINVAQNAHKLPVFYEISRFVTSFRKNQSLVSVLSQKNPVYNVMPCFFNIYIYIYIYQYSPFSRLGL
jgi:hypothetical protein